MGDALQGEWRIAHSEGDEYSSQGGLRVLHRDITSSAGNTLITNELLIN